MSDTDESLDEPTNMCNKQMTFVNILKDNQVLLSKSQVPSMRKRMAEAMKNLISEYERQTGIKMTDKQIAKKVNNMKNDVKRKADVKRTGNRPKCSAIHWTFSSSNLYNFR